MYHFLLYLCLIAALLFGLLITVMALPGLWLMLAATAGYAWLTHGAYIAWRTLAVLLALALVAEVIEAASAGAGAKRAGGGRRGLWGAIIGGILGGIFLSFIPIPILSTFVGVCLGTFLGATIAELSGGRELGRSAIIGVGAAAGRVKGTLLKLGFGLLMMAIVLWSGLPINRRHALPSASPGTQPAAQFQMINPGSNGVAMSV